MMDVSELFESKAVYDLRHEESSLKYWGNFPYAYINPKDGFYFHYDKGILVLHSTENDRYSMVVVNGGEAKDKTVPDLWNQLSGLVVYATKLIVISKENYADRSYRQRVIADIQHFQKALKALKPYGVDDSFKVKGAPPYIAKIVGEILKMDDYTNSVLTLKPMIMYHGTSLANWEIIAKQGLRPGKTPDTYNDLVSEYSEHNVYLSSTPKGAEFYGKRQAQKDGSSKYVILAIKVPDPAKILADDRVIQRYKRVDGKDIPTTADERRMSGSSNERIARSGRAMGEFAYRGNILPSHITLLRATNVPY